MTVPALTYSADQAAAFDSVTEMLRHAGIDLDDNLLMPPAGGADQVLAVTGKAGSGKTLLLAELYKALENAGVDIVSGDYERKKKDKRTLAILAPTNKAASVLRLRGVPATTIHRILYTPVYDPEYERIAEWLAGSGERPVIEGMNEVSLDRAFAFYENNKSIPGALAAAGLRGSDFITGWKRREEPLDIGFVDESSMLDDKQFEDLKEIFPTLLLFGDPAQLAPVGQSGTMVISLAAVVGVIITVCAIMGSSNAVNFTDGLDGLAVGSVLIVSMVFYVFTYIAGHAELARELYVPAVSGAGELSVVCAGMMGACLGFLWFNCFPARVFMGDTGSLALGGSLGIVAVLVHQPWVLVIAGGIFVIEAASVIIQRSWFKWTRIRTGEGRRIFLKAPLHHHFQEKGWHENQVVVRFYIIGILFAVLALATLKLR